MAPKASAASKGKAPERQPTVSPAPEEPGPSDTLAGGDWNADSAIHG